MKKWNVVYWNDSENRSKIQGDIWADDYDSAKKVFLELYPEVTRVIGIYEIRTGGCNC
ncbi:hypothetical protein SP15_292 [Bacillus phage SP-15]|uniref:Uncharacterized protein n=1 Tax=Bacillus phage SP-15 TaxID=1792032 RepID=A0A127AWV6_9CAUD|nr:hypothetical protein SP15_292 [Bacillus phage SP-15]AMM45100.1 hypothetical protein SP15_292 [Bacillus phage SP-15]